MSDTNDDPYRSRPAVQREDPDCEESTRGHPVRGSGAGGSAPTDSAAIGDRVREVREHLEKARAALNALDLLLPAPAGSGSLEEPAGRSDTPDPGEPA